MALLMTDYAAGGQAARQMQQNVIGSQYDQATADAAAEETQLKLQENRLKAAYAPQVIANEAEQEELRLKTARLQALAKESEYKADVDSTQKLRDWMQTDKGKVASDSDIIKKAAAFKFETGLVDQGSKLMGQAERLDAIALANEAKQLTANNETIGKAYAAIDAVPDYQVDQYFEGLPEATKKLITDQTGKENWMMYTGAEKKQVVGNLFANATGLLRKQIVEANNNRALALGDKATERAGMAQDGQDYRKQLEVNAKLDVAMQQSIDKIKELANKLEVAQLRANSAERIADLKKELADAKATKKDKDKDNTTDFKGQEFYYRESDRIAKKYKDEIETAQADYKRLESKVTPSTTDKIGGFFTGKTAGIDPKDSDYKAYSEKVNKFFDLHKQQYEEERKVLEDAPDFPSKARLLKSLNESIVLSESNRTKQLSMEGKVKPEVAPAVVVPPAPMSPAAATDRTAPVAPAPVAATVPAATKTSAAPITTTAKDAIPGFEPLMPNYFISTNEDTKGYIDRNGIKQSTLDEAKKWLDENPSKRVFLTYDLKNRKWNKEVEDRPTDKKAATSNKSAAPKFEEGKVYTDAKGNKAKYVNGKWEPQ